MSLDIKAPTDSGDSSTPDDLVELGWVAGAHGIKGWIKVQPFSVDSEALGSSKRWWLRPPQSPLATSAASATSASSAASSVKHTDSPNDSDQPSAQDATASLDANTSLPGQQPAKPIDLVWAKPHGASWIACVKGLNDRDQAHALKGQTILLSRQAFPKLAADEYYWVDLIGCAVTTDSSGELEHLGRVESVQDNPAHPLLLVKQQQKAANGEITDSVDDKGATVYSLIPFVSAHVGDIDLSARTIGTHWPRDF